MKLFAEKLSKRGLSFSYNSITGMTAGSQDPVRAAVEELEQQVNKELIPVPDGQPMFLFFGAKGKIRIGGIGSTTVYAEGEYLVAMETVDGKAQQMAGLAVKSITSDFPDLDITAAAEDVKNAAPRNKSWDIQRCKFQPSIGGTVDCLI